MIPPNRFLEILQILKTEFPKWDAPLMHLKSVHQGSPFNILISTVLSSRTKDPVTALAATKILDEAKTPYDLSRLPLEKIEKLIFPVGFYKTKAKHLRKISETLINHYNSEVPDQLEKLLELPGVGRKTANLVLSLAFDIPAICVDTHVHRIANRTGIVRSKTPLETEKQLQKKIPPFKWREINLYLVAFGQTICKPIKPECFHCPVEKLCSYPFKTKL